jgi:hypothetical protein
MSKLAKQIEATFTGDVVASRKLNMQYTDVKLDVFNKQTDYGVNRVYRVQAKLGMQKVIDTISLDANFDISKLVLRDIKRSVIEEIFGEFRPFLIEMRTAIYEQDDLRLRTLLATLEHQMFYEGVE